MNFKGIIIEESLENKNILKDSLIRILKTEVEKVSSEYDTPWLKKWTMHTVEVREDRAMDIAEKIAKSLDKEHSWYVDFRNDEYHFIIFKDKIFCVKMENKKEYEDVKKYGRKIGIPEHQLDFDKN
jgi:hypothetical protein